jgi:hypothetical protein
LNTSVTYTKLKINSLNIFSSKTKDMRLENKTLDKQQNGNDFIACVTKRFRALEILVGCEESQEVTKALREIGHNAKSCDIQECSGGMPDHHY